MNHSKMEERIVLVDKDDREIGTEEKIKVHRQGKLHRAFSVFVFNSKGEKLLQRRARTKYHSGGLWTNTCCSHPRPGEPAEKAAHRRLQEEMGFDCELKEVFNFTYRAKLDKNLIEHEYDHVFVGEFEGEPNPNPEEIDDWKWIGLEELKRDMQENPDSYTYWLRVVFDKVVSHLKDNAKLR
jgi:isopentenyl-diphosphate delta-isomerase